MKTFIRRWQRAQAEMARAGVDWLLLTPSSDLYYMTGYGVRPSERITCFALPVEGAPRLVLPRFELPRLDQRLRGEVQCHTWEETDDPLTLIGRVLGDRPARVAVGEQIWGVFLLGLMERLPGRQWLSAGPITSALRMVKDEEEVRLLAEAQAMACRALARLLESGLTGKTEREAARELMRYRQEEGLDTAGSAGIVASGPNGASPHHINSDRVIQRGDAVVIDFGGGHQGYRADITRTPHVGPASQEFKEAYAVVLEAHAAALAATRPGVPCEEIDAAARGVIAAAGYGQYFIHRLGHGLGLDGHEAPYMVAGNRLPLEAGMVFTDEPGIYIPDRFGIRIEDVVHVTESGARLLTHLPRELQEID